MSNGKFYFKFVVLFINKDKSNALCNSNANKQILKCSPFLFMAWFYLKTIFFPSTRGSEYMVNELIL